MSRRLLVPLMALVLIGLVPGLASAATAPSPTAVSVKSVSYSGTGCPTGSVGFSFSADRTSLTLIFDSLVATTGPGVAAAEKSKACKLALNVVYPGAFKYAVSSIDYNGFVQAPSGSTAEHRLTGAFEGLAAQPTSGVTFRGPISRDYLLSNALPAAGLVWSPCGRPVPLNLVDQVRVTAPATARAQLGNSSIDGKVKVTLRLSWRSC